jgi:uncharacterized protein YjbI with pentapeptide repeats
MANPEHLRILGQGIEVWNRWRQDNPEVLPDLEGASLKRAILVRANIVRAFLRGADLEGANLESAMLLDANLVAAILKGASLKGAILLNADLSDARLDRAGLEGAILEGTDLEGADLRGANLMEANLRGANLRSANLEGALLGGADLGNAMLESANLVRSFLVLPDFRGANLQGADLGGAILRGAELEGADIENASLGWTAIDDVDLCQVKGLESVKHIRPSSIGTDALEQTAAGVSHAPSRQGIVEAFLRGAGVGENMVRYFRSRIGKPIEFCSCFISYCHADRAFAQRLLNGLRERGIRCWLDEHQLLPGDDIFEMVGRGMRQWDKILLCCSKASLTSWWVDREIRTALEKEQQLIKDRGNKNLVLVPLDLDRHLFNSEFKNPNASQLESRVAADFFGWDKDSAIFDAQFERVVESLRTDQG